jgi:hypothetical protein
MQNTTEGVHVTTAVPNGTGWVTQAKGVILSRHRSKEAAIVEGRRLAKRHGEPLTIHNSNGNVMETRSYEVSRI